MIYLCTPNSPAVRAVMDSGELGYLVNPNIGNRLHDGWSWAVDVGNVRLIDRVPMTDPEWTPDKWLRLLDRHAGRPGCLFAVVPDWIGDAARTDDQWSTYLHEVVDRGYRPAYVTQPGCDAIPDDAGAVFTGGDDEWKMGRAAHALVQSGRDRGLWCHMGRVNTLARIRTATRDGYDSADGTCIGFGPDVNLPKILSYLRRTRVQPSLFGAAFT